ncbi:hypothetical protein MJI37_22780 [Salmonella enterica subsp. enterica serovar Cerro]|nr:hypothetical protein [Salmonella enterica subsp. enterica serovar Cerro]
MPPRINIGRNVPLANGVDVGGCINTLTSHHPSPLAKGNPQHTNLVEIKRA